MPIVSSVPKLKNLGEEKTSENSGFSEKSVFLLKNIDRLPDRHIHAYHTLTHSHTNLYHHIPVFVSSG